MQNYIVRQIGEHRGAPRIYLELAVMADAGFTPGKTYSRNIDSDKRRITLTLEANGTHVVSRKEKNGLTLPVIDINSSGALKHFEGLQAVRVVCEQGRIMLLPMASETRLADRLQRLDTDLEAGVVTTAATSFGGGVLDHAAHTGLHASGIAAKLVMANEIDEDLLMHAREHNDVVTPSTVLCAAPMQELVQDDAAMARLPKASVFCLGIPCSGSSRAGRTKRGLAKMEDHPQVGHLVASAIMLLNRINPAVVVVENTPEYEATASAVILRQHLRDSAYDVQEMTLDANEFGCMEHRKRWFLVAAARGLNLNLGSLSPSVVAVRTLGELLDDVPEDSPEWRSFSYLIDKEERDQAKGNGFAMQIVTPASTRVPVLRKGYHKGGSTDPLLAHPSDPSLMRLLSVAEHARVKDIPPHLAAGMTKTAGHAMLGQSVAYRVVTALFERIGQELLRWKSERTAMPSQNIGYSLRLATG